MRFAVIYSHILEVVIEDVMLKLSVRVAFALALDVMSADIDNVVSRPGHVDSGVSKIPVSNIPVSNMPSIC